MGIKLQVFNFEKRLEESVKRINQSGSISENNKKHMLWFRDMCLAQGISTGRIAKYLYHLRYIVDWLGKDLDKVTKEDVLRVMGIVERKPYSDWTKIDYKVTIKKFFKLYKGNGEEFPEEVKWLKTTHKNHQRKIPEELLTEDDIIKIIEAANHPRDKAMISLIYEAGLRAGELLSLQIKHVEFNDLGGAVTVKGKTGMRKVMIVSSVPYIATWLGMHPKLNGNESPLWVSKGNQKNNPKNVEHQAFIKILRVTLRKSGITKRVYPHLFRHSRATQMANHLTEAQMNHYFGWVQGSDMPATYVHLSGRDLDHAIKKFYGIEEPEEKKGTKIKPKNCAKCEKVNTPTAKFCERCGGVLDVETAIEITEKRRQSDEIMNAMLEDPKIKKMLVKKLMTTELGKRMMRIE